MHKNMWEFRQSAKPDTVELYIYSTVEADKWLAKSETSAKAFRDALAQHPNAKEITVYINSLGGSVMEGIAIYNQLKRHPAHKTVRVDGFACSIASVIAMAGDTVIMPKNTVMMVHNAWTIAMGNSRELHKAADDLEVINQASRQAYLEKAGDKLTEEKLTELLDGETYLTAAQCIELGLADSHGDDEAEDTSGQSAAQQLTELTVQQRLEQELMQRREKAVAAINKYFG
jgi:ATP-dependent protease ClpP protease subunit